MKKFFCAVLLIMLIASSSFAASHRVGLIEKININASDFAKIYPVGFTRANESLPAPTFKFYDTINAMQLALKAGEIDELAFPEVVANYLMSANPKYLINCVVVFKDTQLSFAFGFKSGNESLRDEFNKALDEIKRDGTLITLQAQFLTPNTSMMGIPTPIYFTKFDGARTIKIAVTGDLPPLDYISPDGKPDGFNAALLSEIARRLKFNVEFLNIDSHARASVLSSGRADSVFWFEIQRGLKTQSDVPEGIILSEPYYNFDTVYHLKLAD